MRKERIKVFLFLALRRTIEHVCKSGSVDIALAPTFKLSFCMRACRGVRFEGLSLLTPVGNHRAVLAPHERETAIQANVTFPESVAGNLRNVAFLVQSQFCSNEVFGTPPSSLAPPTPCFIPTTIATHPLRSRTITTTIDVETPSFGFSRWCQTSWSGSSFVLLLFGQICPLSFLLDRTSRFIDASMLVTLTTTLACSRRPAGLSPLGIFCQRKLLPFRAASCIHCICVVDVPRALSPML